MRRGVSGSEGGRTNENMESDRPRISSEMPCVRVNERTVVRNRKTLKLSGGWVSISEIISKLYLPSDSSCFCFVVYCPRQISVVC